MGRGPRPAPRHRCGDEEQAIPAHPGDQRGYYAGIVAALHGDGPNPVPPEEALAVMSIVEAAAASSASGCAIVPVLTGLAPAA